MTKVILITGCLGFIGRHFTSLMIRNGHHVIGVDAETYAADLNFIDHVTGRGRYIKANIADLDHLPDVDVIVNFAAETHVDNSITDSLKFVHSNVIGVQNLLELVRAKRNYEMPHFIQISTDEVYGDYANEIEDFLNINEKEVLECTGESSPLNPSNPYAASKAAADLLVQSYARTYGIKYNLVRPSNCYGRGQYPEKLIPKAIRYLRLGKKIPIHGDGTQLRSWLWVEDAARAVECVMNNGTPNEIYNIGGKLRSINEIVRSVIACYDACKATTRKSVSSFAPKTDLYFPEDSKPLIYSYYDANEESYMAHCQYNYVRPGIDQMYQVSDTKLRSLGWSPSEEFIIENIHTIVNETLTYPIKL